MVLAAFVEWVPLIELLGWVGGGILAVGSGAIGAVWLVANGAKRCASNAGKKADRADVIVQGFQREMNGMRKDMQEGFAETHKRLDHFFGGE